MKNPIAIDIVFLLPKKVEEEAKRINKILVGTQKESEIDFTQSPAMPHISLAMGGILPEKIKQLTEHLMKFSAGKKSIEITINSLITKGEKPETITSFQFEENDKLNTFHTDLFNLVYPLMNEKVDGLSFLSDEISADSINWVNQYFEKHSFDNFWPHITLGKGKYEHAFQSLQFLASRLAICKLDDYCTCKEIIWESSLH